MDFEFSMEGSKVDPGEELQRKTLELLNNPLKELTYSEAFTLAQQQNPELARAYSEIIRKTSE